jgi:hypothetical protein
VNTDKTNDFISGGNTGTPAAQLIEGEATDTKKPATTLYLLEYESLIDWIREVQGSVPYTYPFCTPVSAPLIALHIPFNAETG